MRSNIPLLRCLTTPFVNSRLMKHRLPALVLALAIALLVGTISASAAISFLLKWGSTGTANGQFLSPNGIATDNAGNVYVADSGNNRVQEFDSSGNFILKFGIPGDVPGGFVTTSGIAVDSSGNSYVTDSFTNRVSKFNSSGTFVLTWGGLGGGDGQFFTASGVAVDSSGNVYVTDANSGRIQKFTSAGVFITKWGTSGSGDGQLNGAQGLVIDSSNNVYVADTGNNRIQKFTSTGTFITKWGTSGSADGEFSSPFGVGGDSSGNVYVSDGGNNRIQKFSSTGTFLEAFGSAGSGDGQFSGNQDVAGDSSGNIYVADTGNDRVQKLGTAVAPPVANAGPDQTVECTGATTSVTLDGTGSTGGGTLTYTWKEGTTVLGTGATLVVSLPTGSHTITLTVSSSGGSSDDTVVINVVDTQAPTITLNGANPMTVECHTTFTDPGATANDGCAGDLTSSIIVTGSVNPNVVGSYTLTYSVSDGNGHTTTATRTVNVVDSTKPVITLNGANPMTVECHSTFTDPGAVAHDSCSGDFPATASGSVNVNVPGAYIITYNATDPSGNSAIPVTRTVNVVDTTAPTITLNGQTITLWPPNHKYETVRVTDFVTGASDGCDASVDINDVVISQVTSDELDNSGGDGNTTHDIVIASNCKSVQLRSERDGGGNGRVYTITFSVRDTAGHVTTATAKVTVPKSQGNGGAAVDDGPHYTVNGSCP